MLLFFDKKSQSGRSLIEIIAILVIIAILLIAALLGFLRKLVADRAGPGRRRRHGVGGLPDVCPCAAKSGHLAESLGGL